MRADNQRVVLITGASSGIGRACAEELSSHGYRVYGTSRRPPMSGLPYEMLQMDGTDDASVEQGVATVLSREGRIDALVNNAGYSLAGAVEETSIEEVRLQFETNFMGAVRLTHAVLPKMRAQGTGTIVNISSIAGLIAIPFQAFYSASKFALEGYSEGLRMEVDRFGVRVVLVEPGDHKTATTANRVLTAASTPDSPYRRPFEAAVGVMAHDEQHGPEPSGVARVVRRVIEAKSPPLRVTVGRLDQKAAAGLKRVVPYALFEKILRNNYKL